MPKQLVNGENGQVVDFMKPSIESVATADEAKQIAIDFQVWASEQSLSYGELAEAQGYFQSLAEKFGQELVDEFKENGIC